ncbi:unnamed protein product [Effrenium voratum]|nr:unnamed protein product [Effrenium voratum]
MPGETAPTVAVTSGTSTGASGPSGVAPKPKQESALESAAPTATHTFGLPEINNYASPSFQKAFAGSPEAVALKLGEDCCFGAGFLRLMECKLNTVVWELYAQMTQDQDVSIVVNMRSPAKPEARAQVPAPPNLQLPFVSRVDFFMEAAALATSSVMVPAWGARAVTRANQAFFKSVTRVFDVALVLTDAASSLTHDFQLVAWPLDTGRDHANSCVKEQIGDKPHVIFQIRLQCLMPLPDIDDKLEKEWASQQASVEKTVKTWISAAAKAKARATSKKKSAKDGKAEKSEKKADSTKSNQTAEMFAQLGLDLPETADAQVQVLKELLEQESKIEECVARAKSSVLKATSVPITKLASEEGQGSITKGKKSRNDEAKEVLQLGRHLLK